MTAKYPRHAITTGATRWKLFAHRMNNHPSASTRPATTRRNQTTGSVMTASVRLRELVVQLVGVGVVLGRRPTRHRLRALAARQPAPADDADQRQAAERRERRQHPREVALGRREDAAAVLLDERSGHRVVRVLPA